MLGGRTLSGPSAPSHHRNGVCRGRGASSSSWHAVTSTSNGSTQHVGSTNEPTFFIAAFTQVLQPFDHKEVGIVIYRSNRIQQSIHMVMHQHYKCMDSSEPNRPAVKESRHHLTCMSTWHNLLHARIKYSKQSTSSQGVGAWRVQHRKSTPEYYSVAYPLILRTCSGFWGKVNQGEITIYMSVLGSASTVS